MLFTHTYQCWSVTLFYAAVHVNENVVVTAAISKQKKKKNKTPKRCVC